MSSNGQRPVFWSGRAAPLSDTLNDSRAAVRHLGGQSAVVMGGTAFTFLVGMPFQIYLARSLGTVGLGIVGIAEALVMTAAGFLSFGLAPLAVRYIPEYRLAGASRAIRVLVITGLGVLSGVGLLVAVVLRPLASALPDDVGIPPESAEVLGILGFLLPASMIIFFLAQALRGFEEIRIVVFSTAILALSAKVMITFVLFMTSGASVRNYAFAIVFSQFVAVLPMIWALWRLLHTLQTEAVPASVNWPAWSSYAGTNYASGLLSALVGNLDRVLVGALLGPAAVGVLMVVRQLGQIPQVFHQAVLTVVSPVFARLKAEGDMQSLAHQLHLANDWVLRMAAGLILTLALLSEPILALYGTGFVEQGSTLMVLIMLAVAVNLGTGPVGILLNMTGYHAALFRVTLLTAIVTFASYFLLIPPLGVAGAGLAILLGNLVNNGAAIWLVQRRLAIGWYDPRFRGWIAPIVGSGTMLLVLRPFLADLEGLVSQAAALVGVLALTYVVFFGINVIVGLHDDDREVLRAFHRRLSGITNFNEPI